MYTIPMADVTDRPYCVHLQTGHIVYIYCRQQVLRFVTDVIDTQTFEELPILVIDTTHNCMLKSNILPELWTSYPYIMYNKGSAIQSRVRTFSSSTGESKLHESCTNVCTYTAFFPNLCIMTFDFFNLSL